MSLTSCGEETNDKVKEIVLNETTYDLYFEDSFKLEALVYPETALNKTITWSTSDASICNVSGGTLIPYKAGEVTITAKNEASGVEASCLVNVSDKTTRFGTRTNYSLVGDAYYRNGFNLRTPHQSHAGNECNLNYGDETKEPTWSLAQWWTPYNFKDATFTKDGNVIKYENENRSLIVDPTIGKISMNLDAGKEYQYFEDTPESEIDERLINRGWPHFLIEQNFAPEICQNINDVYLEGGDIKVKFDVTIDKCEMNKDKVASNCAQLFLYLNVANRKQDGQSDEEYGIDRSLMWFGLPIFDSRYDYTTLYRAYDTGFAGATNRLIYSISSKEYMGDKQPEIGKKYSVDLGVISYIRDAYTYALSNGLSSIYKWENLSITYMNLGWEIPGGYSVGSTFENLDIYSQY